MGYVNTYAHTRKTVTLINNSGKFKGIKESISQYNPMSASEKTSKRAACVAYLPLYSSICLFFFLGNFFVVAYLCTLSIGITGSWQF